MKILFTSDLHISQKEQADKIEKTIRKNLSGIDVLAIAGDINDSRKDIETYRWLSQFGIPVVFCLGNHEFAHRTYQDVLDEYSELQQYGNNLEVYCLDVCDYIDIKEVRFFGNVLWYDGSLCNIPGMKDYYMNRIDGRWLDSTIRYFNPKEACMNNIKRLQNAMEGYDGKSVMITHTCPHRKLNLFDIEQPDSTFNTYSGIDNLFDRFKIYPDYALCGHTHKAANFEFGKTKCINSGNDYFWKTNQIIFDVIEV